MQRPHPQPTELVERPRSGRVFSLAVQIGLADVDPGGRVRLDAIARWLQDAAFADVVDCGLDDLGMWVLRRARMSVEQFPRFGEQLNLETFCSGLGSLYAERRTTIRGVAGGLVEAVALWVHLDASGRPRAPGDEFLRIFGPAAGGRRVKARLRHPAPPPDAPRVPWRFRAADLDLAGHVNNSVYWQVLEEELVAGDATTTIDAELEHRSPAGVGTADVVRLDDMRWLLSDDSDVFASIALCG